MFAQVAFPPSGLCFVEPKAALEMRSDASLKNQTSMKLPGLGLLTTVVWDKSLQNLAYTTANDRLLKILRLPGQCQVSSYYYIMLTTPSES